MFSLSILFYISCFTPRTQIPPNSGVSSYVLFCYSSPTCDVKGSMCSHPKERQAYPCLRIRFSGNDTRPCNNRHKRHTLARIHSLLSFLNSHPSPYLRNIRAMPTDPLTITSSAKAAKKIKAIVSMFFNFKNLCGASGVEPVRDPSVTLLVHRCPRGLGGDRTRLTT